MIPTLCLPTDVGCMAREASGGAFEAVVDALGKGAVTLTKFLSTFWLNTPSPTLASGSGSSWAMDAKIAQMQVWIGPITATIALCSFAVALGRMAWAGDFREGGGALRQVAVVGAGSLVVAATTQVMIAAGDAFSPWIIEQAAAGDASTGMQTLIAAGLNSGRPEGQAGLWLILFLLMGLGSLVQCIFMVFRGPVLWVLQVFVPPTAAGTASEEGWTRFKRLWLVIVAFALYKPVAATIYASGLFLMTQRGSAEDPTNNVEAAIYGLAIMVLGALALPALIKFLVPVAAVGSSSAFSGGAAVGAIAGGAAIIGTVVAAGAGGGAAAGALGAGAGDGGQRADGASPVTDPGEGGSRGGGSRAAAMQGAAQMARGAGERARAAEPHEEDSGGVTPP